MERNRSILVEVLFVGILACANFVLLASVLPLVWALDLKVASVALAVPAKRHLSTPYATVLVQQKQNYMRQRGAAQTE